MNGGVNWRLALTNALKGGRAVSSERGPPCLRVGDAQAEPACKKVGGESLSQIKTVCDDAHVVSKVGKFSHCFWAASAACRTHARCAGRDDSLSLMPRKHNSIQSGVLHVTLSRAIGLRAADSQAGASIDPYIVLTLGHQEMKSRKTRRTHNPEWSQTFRFIGEFDDLCLQPLQIRASDGRQADATSSYLAARRHNHQLGTAGIDLSEYPLGASESFPVEVPLDDEQDTPARVVLELRWVANAAPTTGVLHVKLLRASELRSAQKPKGGGTSGMLNHGSQKNPCARVTLGAQTLQSSALTRTINPEWNESFFFHGALEMLTRLPLTISVWDGETFAKTTLLGQTQMNIDSYQCGA